MQVTLRHIRIRLLILGLLMVRPLRLVLLMIWAASTLTKAHVKPGRIGVWSRCNPWVRYTLPMTSDFSVWIEIAVKNIASYTVTGWYIVWNASLYNGSSTSLIATPRIVWVCLTSRICSICQRLLRVVPKECIPRLMEPLG